MGSSLQDREMLGHRVAWLTEMGIDAAYWDGCEERSSLTMQRQLCNLLVRVIGEPSLGNLRPLKHP